MNGPPGSRTAHASEAHGALWKQRRADLTSVALGRGSWLSWPTGGLSPEDTGLDAGLGQFLFLLPSPWKLASEMNFFQGSKCYRQASARQAGPLEETLLLCDGENTVSLGQRAVCAIGFAASGSHRPCVGRAVSWWVHVLSPYGFAIICRFTEFSEASCFMSAHTSTPLFPAQKPPALPGTHDETGTPRRQQAWTERRIIQRETLDSTT